MNDMGLAPKLVIEQKPLVLSITLSRNSYKDDSELIKVIADGVNFARAGYGAAQVLIKADKKLADQKDELAAFIRIHTTSLQIEKEGLIVKIDKVVDNNLRLTIRTT